MNERLARVTALLGLAERSIALIDRCRPSNAASEARRVSQLWADGQPRNPAWVYARPPDFGPLRSELVKVSSGLAGGDPIDALYAARADELVLEARIAEAIGSPHFAALARQRFPVSSESRVREQARAWARSSAPALGKEVGEAETIRSDARADSRSLLSQMLSEVALQKLPISVLLKDDLQSVAATTSDGVLIKPGVLLSAGEARRIVVHELLGHALPRLEARAAPLGLFRIGAAGSADDEEGRALWLERRSGLLTREREVELGRRHLAAVCAAEGADWVETVRTLLTEGAPSGVAMEIANRVQRGGGLAREVVYLPAFARVERALEDDPELDEWLAAGRLSLQAARVLRGVWPALVRGEPAGASKGRSG